LPVLSLGKVDYGQTALVPSYKTLPDMPRRVFRAKIEPMFVWDQG
jgi:hypothetical protein